MQNVVIYSEWWQGGEKKEFGKGIYYRDIHFSGIPSFVIPAGKRLRWIENKDGSGVQSQWFYGPTQFDEFKRIGKTDPGQLIIEDTTFSKNDMVIVGYPIEWEQWDGKRSFEARFALPPGTYNVSDGYVSNDSITFIEVPPHSVVDLYDNEDESGAHVRLTGNTGQHERYNLDDFNFSRRVSRMHVVPDGWSVVGMEVDQDSLKIDQHDQVTPNQFGLFAELNNDTDSEATLEESLDYRKNRTQESSFESTEGFGISENTEVDVDIGPVEIDESIGLEFHADFTQGSTSGSEDEQVYHIDVSATVPPHSSVKASIIETVGVASGRIARVLRNKRTGAEVKQWGTFKIGQSVRARTETH